MENVVAHDNRVTEELSCQTTTSRFWSQESNILSKSQEGSNELKTPAFSFLINGQDDFVKDTFQPQQSEESGNPSNALSMTTTTSRCKETLSPMDDKDDETTVACDGTCMICFEPWTNSGVHQLCSLRCGHLFGKGCIEMWLKRHKYDGAGRCPQCNGKAKKADIRLVYARKLVALDATEKEAALRQVEKERYQRNQIERELTQLALKYELIKEENAVLRRQLDMFFGSCETIPPDKATEWNEEGDSPGHYVFQRSMTVSREKQASRRIEFDFAQDVLLSTCSFETRTTSGYSHGFIKYSLLDSMPLEMVKLHQKEIKDIKSSPRVDGLVLTASLDKTIKLTSLVSNTIVQSFELDSAAWSCSWNPQCPYEIYGGLADNTIVVLDFRYTSRPLYRLGGSLLDKKLPVHTLTCTSLPISSLTEGKEHASLSSKQEVSSCLFGATLASPFHMDLGRLGQQPDNENGVTSRALQMEPLLRSEPGYHCTSLHLDHDTGYYMASFRDSSSTSVVTGSSWHHPTLHSIAKLSPCSAKDDDDKKTTITSSVLTTFEGPSHQVLLSRSLLFSVSRTCDRIAPSRLLAAISNETTRSLALYQISLTNGKCSQPTPELLQHLPVASSHTTPHDPLQNPRGLLDSCHVVHPYYGDFLVALTNESQVLLHRWQLLA